LEKQKNINIKIQLKMETIQLTKSEFIKKITDFEKNPTTWKYLGDKPAIIDFYATWCGPCKAVSPIMEELAEEYKDSIYVYKVDTDKEQELSALFGIRSIPSVLFIPMEGAPQMSVGAMPKSGFEKAVHDILLTK
jgi:thioredoxin